MLVGYEASLLKTLLQTDLHHKDDKLVVCVQNDGTLVISIIPVHSISLASTAEAIFQG